MIQVKSFCFNAFQENTYVVWNEKKDAFIIDPGCYTFEERQIIRDFITENQLIPRAIINTHAHVDHVLGVQSLKEIYQIPFGLHNKDAIILHDVKNRALFYGFPHYQETEIDFYLEEGQDLTFGELSPKVFFVPGHAPGHTAFFFEEDKILFSGDVLFRRSIGRTDFPHCDHDALVKSIQTKLYTLPDEVIVYPGHGGPTKIGEEKKLNPFVRFE
ncbi:MAG: hypothetical protein RJA76_188 [Bacteroidota bacterium]|jgi:glyoxylase-like metal-dependent hydrolase (beta-lactamase superfamily II)